MKKRCYVTIFLVLTSCLLVQPGWGISRQKFFEQIDQAWAQVRSFQAQVVQESRYPDGVVQRYQGDLVMAEDGRIAYDYKLLGQYEDLSLVPQGESEQSPEPDNNEGLRHVLQSGAYRVKSGRVNHYDPEQNVLIEGDEEDSLLIQVFRNLLVTGDFDVEKFRNEHSIERIDETTLDGRPVYRMIAVPKKNSEVYQRWIAHTGNDQLQWKQELCVDRETMLPVRAVLIAPQESTSVTLNNPQVNQPIGDSAFLLEVPKGSPPRKFERGDWQSSPQHDMQPVLKEIPME